MRILVGYTDTESGRDALALGARLARSIGAKLDIVVALTGAGRPSLAPPDAGYRAMLMEQADRWLADAAALVPDSVAVRTHRVFGPTFAAGLLTAARDLGSRLIVLGAAQGGVFGRFSVGSTANALLHSSPVPVALAPRGTSESADVDAALSRITLATAPTGAGGAVVRAGLWLSELAHTGVRVLSLAVHGDEDDSGDGAGQAAILERLNKRLSGDSAPLGEVVAGGTVAEAVESVSWRNDEVLVVGSSSLARRGRLFLGPTAARIVRQVPVPVIVVPRKWHAPESSSKNGVAR